MSKIQYVELEEVKEYVESEGYVYLFWEDSNKHNNIIVNKKYRCSHSPINLICPKGHRFETTYYDFKNGHRCNICRHKNELSSELKLYEEVKTYVESIGYKLLNDIDNFMISRKLKLQCEHGHICNITYNSLKDRNERCPICEDKKKKEKKKEKKITTINDVIKLINKEGYTLISKVYIDDDTPLKMICSEGHKFEISFNKFKDKNRCPVCMSNDMLFKSKNIYHMSNSMSKGEVMVKYVLDKYNIPYITQKTFEGCKYNNYLRFDFYIPDMDICIEFDGEQHFRPVDFSGKLNEEEILEQFKLNKTRDRIKTNYCKQHDIKLIRIKYDEIYDIELILKDELGLE